MTEHIFFNPGELSLLLEPIGNVKVASAPASMPPASVKTLKALLGPGLGAKQSVALHQSNPLRGPNNKNRPSLPMTRTVNGKPTTYVLQTVNLSSWSNLAVGKQTGAGLRKAVAEVGAAVSALNALPPGDPRRTIGPYRLVAASPNWRAAPSSDCGPPSPAGRPLQAPAGAPLRTFKPATVGKTLGVIAPDVPKKTHAPVPVRIAVFDTWPVANGGDEFSAIDQCLATLNGRVSKARLNRMRTRPNFAVTDLVKQLNLAQVSAPVSRLDTSGVRDAPYNLSDHGLFVADLIDQIAPDVELHVYRVLTDEGPVVLDSLALAVEDALVQAKKEGKKLVLNFSFGFGLDLLSVVDLLADPELFLDDFKGWVPTIQPRLQAKLAKINNAGAWRQNVFNTLMSAPLATDRLLRQVNPTRYRFIEAMASLQHLFDFTEMDDVLAVAAAGNQSDPNQFFPPQLPAAIEGILGVSAVSEDGKGSDFSNADDVLPPDDGISALGGKVAGFVTTEGPMGLYVSPTFPNAAGTANTVGRTVWAGTSFATPIVAGIAARLWTKYGNNIAQEILTAIAANSRPFIPHGVDTTAPLHQE